MAAARSVAGSHGVVVLGQRYGPISGSDPATGSVVQPRARDRAHQSIATGVSIPTRLTAKRILGGSGADLPCSQSGPIAAQCVG